MYNHPFYSFLFPCPLPRTFSLFHSFTLSLFLYALASLSPTTSFPFPFTLIPLACHNHHLLLPDTLLCPIPSICPNYALLSSIALFSGTLPPSPSSSIPKPIFLSFALSSSFLLLPPHPPSSFPPASSHHHPHQLFGGLLHTALLVKQHATVQMHVIKPLHTNACPRQNSSGYG